MTYEELRSATMEQLVNRLDALETAQQVIYSDYREAANRDDAMRKLAEELRLVKSHIQLKVYTR